MKILDHKGRIFGKVNIINFCIILFVIGAIILGCIKIVNGNGPSFANESVGFKAEILLSALYDGFQDEITIGDKLYDRRAESYLGIVTHKTVTPAVQEVRINDGRAVMSEVPNRWDVILTIEGEGIYNDVKGLQIGGEVRYTDLYLEMRTNKIVVNGIVTHIEVDGH